MKTCIGCGVILTPENKSKYQPTIRCLECFEIFAAKTIVILEAMVEQLAQGGLE